MLTTFWYTHLQIKINSYAKKTTPFGFVALPAFVARDRRAFCPSIRDIIRNVKNRNGFYLNEDELLILNWNAKIT